MAAIRAAKVQLEAEQRARDEARGRVPGQTHSPGNGRRYQRAHGEPKAEAQGNFTDPESRIMKTSAEGFQQCYNAQMAVDGENQLVVSNQLTANAGDQGQLPALLDRVREELGAVPAVVLADAGYCNERDLALLETRGIDGYVAVGREGRKRAAGTPAKHHPATRRMREKLAAHAGRKIYAARKWLSEAPHGWIKEVMGFRRFSFRGLRKAQGEWDLVCLALNLRRLPGLLAA